MSDLFGGGANSGVAGGLPTGVKLAAAALLAHQLMKHARAEQGASGAEPASSGGGLGGLLGSLLGQGGPTAAPTAGPDAPGGRVTPSGGGLAGLLGGLLGGGAVGGLGGLLGRLREGGLGREVDSWVGSGENRPVAPREVERAFDREELDEAARRAGTDRGSLLEELSRMLPGMVDGMTPHGRMPQRGEEMGGGGIEGLLGHLLGGGRR
jgi:uncharacterized protein YidB (DUF937 family)